MIACNKKDITSPHDAQSSVIIELVNSTGKHRHNLFQSCSVPDPGGFKGFIALPIRYQAVGSLLLGCLFMFHTGLYLLFSQ